MTARRRRSRGPYRGKRAVDLALLAAVALPAAVAGGVSALAVRVDSHGPAIFRQTRAGRDGKPFVALKLRTMVDGPNPLIPDPSRITRVGRVLRRTSLDELPQLINVLRGEMSIVGPRPTLPYQVARYDDIQRGRLAVRPGLTGLAQVRGRRSLTWAERIKWDLDYVDRQSPELDFEILLRTVIVVLTGEGIEGHGGVDPIVQEIPGPASIDPSPAGAD